jgi:hypothetical protein
MITSVIRIKEYFSKVHVRVKGFVKGNWGYPFIAGFMVLLFLGAVFLASGLGYLAEPIADVAYFALVAGAVLQLIYLTVSKRKSQGVVLDRTN